MRKMLKLDRVTFKGDMFTFYDYVGNHFYAIDDEVALSMCKCAISGIEYEIGYYEDSRVVNWCELPEKKMDVKHCVGCEQNFYNGNNPHGVKECWMLESAKLVSKKQVSVNDVPPWNHKPTLVPSCYSKLGYVFIDPKRTN